MTRYRTIVADPPWDVPRGSQYRWRSGRPSGERQALEYGTLSVAEIAAICPPVAADAHLFMWTTQGYLERTFDVTRAWGFEPVCTLVWAKAPHGWGPGGAFQSTVEFVVYAKRGKPAHEGQVDRQWWTWPRAEHSAKPDGFLDMVEQHFPGPYLEMFARRARFGWSYWGDESLGTATLPASTASAST